jgi:DNA-binding NarL/FixJ family response regulator
MSTLRILVADDHDVVRRGLRSLIEGQSGWQVVGEAATGRQAVREAKRLRPDIVVLDIGMPELNGLDVARQILKALPRTEVLIVTMHEGEVLIRQALESGARGFILKTEAARHFVSAVEALAAGKPFFTSGAAQVVLQGFLNANLHGASRADGFTRLTDREREIIQLLAEGKSNKEVSGELGISVRTAECHRTNIMRKLSLHSMSGLIRYAIRNNIVQV